VTVGAARVQAAASSAAKLKRDIVLFILTKCITKNQSRHS
jgi:hypothetical protein